MTFLRLIARNRLGAIGGVVLLIVVLLALITPLLPLQPPNVTNTADRYLPPFSEGHLLGTDHLGRDLLSRIIYGARVSRSAGPRYVAKLAQLGYAAPGAVLAVGVLFPFAALDTAVADAVEGATGWDPGLILTGSAAAVVFAYVVRFSAIAIGSVDGAFGRVTPSMEMAARALGETRSGALRRVHLPLIRGSVLSAALLIFVDSAKELPATLILRPFDFDTLATRVYGAASLENIREAGPPALAIVLVGLAPVILLMRSLRRSRPGE